VRKVIDVSNAIRKRSAARVMNPVCYEVIVPTACSPGDSFACIVNGREFTVAVPVNVKGGDKIVVSVDREDHGSAHYVGVPRRYFYVLSESRVPRRFTEPRASTFFTMMCLLVEILVACLLVASYGSYWSSLEFSGSCGAVSPQTGNPLTKLYYNLLRGVGSDEECTNSADDFCIRWTNFDSWAAIDSVTASDMEREARYNWNSSLVVIPLSSGFVILACILHCGVLCCPRTTAGNELTMSLLVTGGFSLWIGWALCLSGLNSVVYTTTMNPTYWLRLFRSGLSFASVLAGSNTPLAPNDNDCSVRTVLAPGASLVSTAAGISFFIGLFLLCTCCCGACFEEEPLDEDLTSTYRRHDRQLVYVARAQPPLIGHRGHYDQDEESKSAEEDDIRQPAVTEPKVVRAIPISQVEA